MSRRRNSESTGLNLDSLMDCLTNVVGVLIIILVIVQINVSRATKKILSDVPEVTAPQLVEMERKAEIITKDLATAKKDAAATTQRKEKDTRELATARTDLADLESKTETQKVRLAELDQVMKALEEKRQEVAAVKTEMDKKLAEEERLKALLVNTPVPKMA